MQYLSSLLKTIKAKGSVICVAVLVNGSAFSALAQTSESPVLTPAEIKLNAQRRLEKLRFGQVLFEYYQQQPLKSLEAVAIAEHYGVARADRPQLQLIQGGASLQLGMTESAIQLLTELLRASQPKEVQAQAWYWLAKTAFQQGLFSVSQQAREYLQDNQLMAVIEEEQWLELQYQSAFFALKSNPSNWRNTVNALPKETIWYPYLMANAGIQLFNQKDYGNAAQMLVDAIDAAKIQPEQITLTQSLLEWSWWPWSEDGGRVEDSPEYRERNTLLDRLYYSVGQTFVKLNNHVAAFNAFKQIQSNSLYAERGLLAYGWALANEERWGEALPVWQHLRDKGKGLPSLQATHALAYGFEQLTDYAKAYAMLVESLSQLEQARVSLANMQALKSQSEFILRLAELSELPVDWPLVHQDLILDLLSGDNQQNTAKQLQSLVQLNNILEHIEKQQDNLNHLEQLLDERADALASRAAALSIERAETKVVEYTQTLQRLAARVANAADNPDHFANQQQSKQRQRLLASEARLKRLSELTDMDEDDQTALEHRLSRVTGILDWELNEQQIIQQYEYEEAIEGAEQVLHHARQRLDKLLSLTNNPAQLRATLINQYQRLSKLRESYTEKQAKTRVVQGQLVASLQSYLLTRMQQRDAVLLEQITATKLAMLRMQDVSFSRQQQFRNEP